MLAHHPPSSPSGDLRATLENKARELFSLCDPRGKGYATQTDLQALWGELPLHPSEVERVFSELDADGDGKLTLQEFTDGFGVFLGIDTLPCQQQQEDNEAANEVEDDEMLEELLDHLGARNLFTDEEYLREMWQRVRKQDPVMLSNFENFISKMAGDLKESSQERTKLQNTMNRRKQDHETQVQSLYMEMEEQLKVEKEKILQQEQEKEQRLRSELETELSLKDNQLKTLLEKHAEMESQLAELNSEDSAKKYENMQISKDRDELESRLCASERMLSDMKNQLKLLRQKSIEERRNRAQSALRRSEGIALERENLVMELHHLKEVNKKLLDEKDELVQSTAQNTPTIIYSPCRTLKKSPENHQNDEPDKTFKELNLKCDQPFHNLGNYEKSFHTVSLDRDRTYSDVFLDKDNSHVLKRGSSDGGRPEDMEGFSSAKIDSNLRNNLNYSPKEFGKCTPPPSSVRCKSRPNSEASNISRKPSLQYKLTKHKSVLEDAAPTRVFKVVFVGDSGVGKTSILQRFCTDTFKSTFSATIGVDFQVKTIEVDGERIALQLWDTAGQERFRSMTHQYFRKADGIIVVYDVTSESTFRNVRNWMHNIKEGAQEGVMVMLLGNKVDLCVYETDRVVRTKDGTRLADEYESLFFETSAKTGDSISDAIDALASILKTKEDEAMEHTLKYTKISYKNLHNPPTTSMEVTTTLLIIIATYLGFVIGRWALKRRSTHQLFRKYGIPGPHPSFLTGNMSQLRAGQTPNETITRWIKEYGNVFGYFIGGVPYVVVNDLDLLKQVFVKDFHVFSNRPEMVLDVSPLNKTLLALKDKRWKEVRSILTPTFSSGKIKLMTSIVDKKVDVTVSVVSKRADKNEMFDIYELIQGLTLDVIADCALAMKTHCQENPKDIFLIAVRDFFKYAQNPAVDFAIVFPFVGSIMTFVTKNMTAGQMTDLIVDNVNSAIEARKRDPSIKSVDILQLMLDSRENDSTGSELTDEEIIANAYIFLLAGYETTATALAFTFYLLIKHPEIQEKLYKEIQEAGDVNYNTVQNLQYLDQVFSESLRYYPPVTGFVTRYCDADHQLGSYTVPKGSNVLAPVWDIHHDPDLWPDPWTFNPDRFSPDNKTHLNSMAFLPFGAGRRNCVGARFAQLEAKLALFRLLKEFRFEACEKTDDPLVLVCPTVIINPANGVYLRAVRRQ
ncbi:hypothetical protein JTE90_001809 [Oedothorax gibbosus]|uniref:EF-hand domain-containing protein n=1 Tax=Oedothorax gibbosus TaxID=931172 RepID=A0AAV6VTI7_9ARAC|nr:hypothetical protein JTE90_001809 [Oedothorax gibbosus]